MKATLKKSDALALLAFCEKHNKDNFFFAKDQGVYFGQTHGSQSENNFENHIVYCDGFNPDTNDDWWESASDSFGGDDFGEMLEIDILKKFASDERAKKLVLKITATTLKISFTG